MTEKDHQDIERATLNQILGMQTEMLRYQRTREENEQKRYETLRSDVRQLRQEQHDESILVRKELSAIKTAAKHDADVGLEGLTKAEALEYRYTSLEPAERRKIIGGILLASVPGIFAVLTAIVTSWGMPSWWPESWR